MRTESRLGALALVLLAPACAVEVELGAAAQPIIEGDVVSDDAYPTVGGIATNAGSICTGTLISPTAVLTAAHCVEPNLLKQAMQQAGQTPPDEIVYKFTFARDMRAASEEGLFLDVESVTWHEEFLSDPFVIFETGPTQWNDIAVVHLAEPVTDRDPQRLAPSDVVEVLEQGRMHAVAGYGLTNDDDPMSAGVLTAGQSGLGEMGEFELIAGEGDRQQACRGDSGGPIFADDGDTYQIGIASRINAAISFPPPTEPPPCETGLLYTRVDSYLPWIGEHVDDFEAEDGGGSSDGGADEGDGDGGGDGDGDGGGGEPEPGSGGTDEGGCSLGGGAGHPASLALIGFAALGLRRRRRF